MNEGSERPVSTGSEPLSKRLFGGSAVIHRQAERRPFMVVFFKAELPRDAYIEYLGRLSSVYGALEETSEALRTDPVVGVMHSPELYRSTAIDADMTFLVGSDWRDRIKPSPATESYVAAIRGAASTFPPGWVAHQWLRYLGNVLAQQVNLRIMKRAYGFDTEGTAFYRYDKITDPRAYLGEYHARLNAMPLTEEQVQGVIDEANRAWQHQIDFTDELAADFGLRKVSEDEAEKLMQELAANHP